MLIQPQDFVLKIASSKTYATRRKFKKGKLRVFSEQEPPPINSIQSHYGALLLDKSSTSSGKSNVQGKFMATLLTTTAGSGCGAVAAVDEDAVNLI